MPESQGPERYAGRRLTRRGALKGTVAAGLGAAALGLVGCGDDDDSGKTPSAGGSPKAAPTVAAQDIDNNATLTVGFPSFTAQTSMLLGGCFLFRRSGCCILWIGSHVD